jgi:RNA polymerase sigma-70 factor (ECF subfamily)
VRPWRRRPTAGARSTNGSKRWKTAPTLGRALDRLNGVDRRLVSLRYQHDMTYKSTAEALGMPEGTVKVRLHRIHKKLSSALHTTAGEW